MGDINVHILGVKQNPLEKDIFYDKYHRKLFQTWVTVVCRALWHPHTCDDGHSIFPIQGAHNMGKLDHHKYFMHGEHHNQQPSFCHTYQMGNCQVEMELYNKN